MPLSPVIAAKKARPSDGGSDEVCYLSVSCCDVLEHNYQAWLQLVDL